MTQGETIVGLLAGLMLLAGCVSDGDPLTPTDEDAKTPGQGGASPEDADGNAGDRDVEAPKNASEPAGIISQTGCAQLHVFYTTPWSSWETSLPAGFGPDGTDPTGQTTTAYQHISRCTLHDDEPSAQVTTTTEAWFGVAVTPPDELVDPDAVIHLVPIELIVDDADLRAVYAGWGFDPVLREGEITWTDTMLPNGRHGTVTISTGNGSYSLEALIGPAQEGSAEGSDRVFAVEDGTVTGFFDYAWPGWTDLGSGALVFRAAGDAEAPPTYPGGVHQVADTNVTITYTAWTG